MRHAFSAMRLRCLTGIKRSSSARTATSKDASNVRCNGIQDKVALNSKSSNTFI